MLARQVGDGIGGEWPRRGGRGDRSARGTPDDIGSAVVHENRSTGLSRAGQIAWSQGIDGKGQIRFALSVVDPVVGSGIEYGVRLYLFHGSLHRGRVGNIQLVALSRRHLMPGI